MVMLFFFLCFVAHFLSAEPLLESFLNQYERSFTLLDLSKSHHVFRLAKKYNMVGVKASADDSLFEQCKNYSNIILLHKNFSIAELLHLGECERFDVILSDDIRERFGDCWKEAAQAICALGDHAIFWVDANDFELKNYLEENDALCAGKTLDDACLLYVIKAKKNELLRNTWLVKVRENPYKLESSFGEKKLIKTNLWPSNASKEVSWSPGINLLTFKMCNGTYPTSEMIKEYINAIKDEPQNDWFINNMILQGAKIVWIDGNEVARLPGGIYGDLSFELGRYHEHLKLIDLDDPAKIEHLFWNKLCRVPFTYRDIVHFVGKIIKPSSWIFDINPSDKQLISAYLGYDSIVVALDLFDKCNEEFEHAFNNEGLIVASRKFLEQCLDILSLDGFIDLYGTPYLCTIHLPAYDAYAYLSDLTKDIPVIAFQYSLDDKESLKECVNLLSLKGYDQFNFTVHDFKFLALFENKHSGKGCSYANADEILSKIEEFNALENESSSLYGYIYAKKEMKTES